MRQGCEQAAQAGAIAGFPIVDVKARLLGGGFHDTDSSDRAFKIAGSMAMREASSLEKSSSWIECRSRAICCLAHHL